MKDIRKDVKEAAECVYKGLGPFHEETIYREAMSIELQERGYQVKTEMPVSIRYKTSKGKTVIIGEGAIDLYVLKDNYAAIIELKKAADDKGKSKKKKTDDERDQQKSKLKKDQERYQLYKYFHSLDYFEKEKPFEILIGFVISFPKNVDDIPQVEELFINKRKSDMI